jgi:hypothetical protein
MDENGSELNPIAFIVISRTQPSEFTARMVLTVSDYIFFFIWRYSPNLGLDLPP